MRIDVFTAPTQFFVLMKLISVSGMPVFAMAGIFIIADWVTAQGLLMDLKSFDVDQETGLEQTATLSLVSELRDSLTRRGSRLIFALHLPTLLRLPGILCRLPALVLGRPFLGAHYPTGFHPMNLVAPINDFHSCLWHRHHLLLEGSAAAQRTDGQFMVKYVACVACVWWWVEAPVSRPLQSPWSLTGNSIKVLDREYARNQCGVSGGMYYTV